MTATTAGGSTSAQSVWTAAVIAAPPATLPVNTQLPQITGTLAVGQTVTLSNGTWTGTPPINFNYQWLRCSSSSSCVIIAGATAQTYVVTQADSGQMLSAWVSATNSAGSVTATAPNTASVGASSGAAQPPSGTQTTTTTATTTTPVTTTTTPVTTTTTPVTTTTTPVTTTTTPVDHDHAGHDHHDTGHHNHNDAGDHDHDAVQRTSPVIR